jgi:hypothetical protein
MKSGGVRDGVSALGVNPRPWGSHRNPSADDRLADGSNDLPGLPTGFPAGETTFPLADVLSSLEDMTFLPPNAIARREETGSLAGKPSRSWTKQARWRENHGTW